VARVIEPRRSRLLLGGLVVLHLVAISRQVDARGGTSVLARAIFATLSPVQRAAHALVGAVTGTWSAYAGLRGVRAENVRLQEKVRYLELHLQERQQQAREAEQLRSLFELRPILPVETLVAEVVARDGVPWYRTLTIDKGEAHGVRLNAPVISATGVVGRVVAVGPSAAKVQLLLDRDSGAGVRLERSRVTGVVTGQLGPGETQSFEMALKYVPLTADVEVGDVVITSGLDQIYPRGLMVGRVSSVSRGSGLFKEITVSPSAGFQALEQVMVVRHQPPDSETPRQLR
jgi:rod shape-determining protein MreC